MKDKLTERHQTTATIDSKWLFNYRKRDGLCWNFPNFFQFSCITLSLTNNLYKSIFAKSALLKYTHNLWILLIDNILCWEEEVIETSLFVFLKWYFLFSLIALTYHHQHISYKHLLSNIHVRSYIKKIGKRTAFIIFIFMWKPYLVFIMLNKSVRIPRKLNIDWRL